MNFILLAAGQGQRMGGNKALMPFNGQAWIRTQIGQILEAGLQNITVVTNSESESALEELLADFVPKIQILTNLHPEQGPFSSLQLAVAASPEEATFLSPVDVPLKSVTLKKLRQAWLQHGHLAALIPAHKNRKGHPVILSTELQRSLLKLAPDHPESRLDFILKALPESEKRTLDLEDPFISINLNTPEDLAALQ